MRRATLYLGLMLALAIGLVSPLAAGAQEAELDCSDFATQEAAQFVLDSNPGSDIEDALDPDGTGVACEDLPSRGGGADEGEDPDQGEGEGEEDIDDIIDGLVPDEGEEEEPVEDPTAEPEEEEEEANANPLDGRFGGSRETFEEEYGDPTGDEEGEYPLGVEYEIDDFAGVNIFYHRDYVAYITLAVNPRDPWTERQANAIAEDFLPADVELEEAEETDDGDLLTIGHSAALETRFGPGTYDDYGAVGEQGDVYYVLRLNDDGDVDTIEIALGNELQQPATEEETTEFTAADIEYIEAAREQFVPVSESMDEFETVLAGLSDGSIEAGDAGARLRVVFDTWRASAQDAGSLEPTPNLEQTHEIYVDFVDLLSAAADDYFNGLQNSDNDLLGAGDQKYAQAQVLRPLIDALLTVPE